MKILYNTITEEIKNHKDINYKGVIKQPWIELEYIVTERPSYDSAQYKLEESVSISNGIYQKVFNLVPYTQLEKDLNSWKYPEYSRKLIVNGNVLFTLEGAAYKSYLDLKSYPMELVDGNIHIWINTVEPQHQPFLDQLKSNNLLTEESIPI